MTDFGEPHSATVDTLLHGDVVIESSESAVTAAYRQAPHTRVHLQRIGERTHRSTPIGTRTSTAIEGSIGDETIVVTPERARLFKRTFRVRLQFGDRDLTLAARTLEDSYLLDGPKDNGDNAFGTLTRLPRGGVDVEWSIPFTVAGRTVEPPVPTREDALVAVAAAAAFGTGGLSLTTMVMGAVSALLP